MHTALANARPSRRRLITPDRHNCSSTPAVRVLFVGFGHDPVSYASQMPATERGHMSTQRSITPGGALLVQSTSAIGRCIGILCALLAAVALLLTGLVSPASAAVDAAAQCSGLDNVGGLGAKCTVTITNNLDLSTGVTSSTVVKEECHGAANTALLCTTTPTSSVNLTTSVTQCNGSENGAGASLECHVIVVNNITGAATAVAATVNQCVGSGNGGGSIVTCNPVQSTTGADITQCGGSGNGGGSTVTCTVTPSTNSSSLPIIINQCVGSGNGGGSLVTCTASITNNILPDASTTTTTAGGGTTTPGGGTTTPGGPADTTVAPGGDVATTTATGPAGGVIGDVQVVTVPTARPGRLPATGSNSGVIGLIGVALVASGAVTLLARRRRPA